MSGIFATIPKGTGGRLRYEFQGAIDHYVNGLPVTANGNVVTNNGNTAPIAYHHQGIPFDTQGRVVARVDTVDRFGQGATPYTVESKVSMTPNGPVFYANGMAYAGNKSVSGQDL